MFWIECPRGLGKESGAVLLHLLIVVNQYSWMSGTISDSDHAAVPVLVRLGTVAWAEVAVADFVTGPRLLISAAMASLRAPIR